jgi:hypothetical protein
MNNFEDLFGNLFGGAAKDFLGKDFKGSINYFEEVKKMYVKPKISKGSKINIKSGSVVYIGKGIYVKLTDNIIATVERIEE